MLSKNVNTFLILLAMTISLRYMQVRLLFCLKQGAKYIWNSCFFVLFRFLCLLILFLFSVFTLNKDRKSLSYALLDESLQKKYNRYEFYEIGNYPNQICIYILSIFSARRKHQGVKSF